MENPVALLVSLLTVLVLAFVGYLSASYTEYTIIKSCEETGVYLSQKGLLVCEWRTPQKIK